MGAVRIYARRQAGVLNNAALETHLRSCMRMLFMFVFDVC
jgi:hypothetical protein